MQRASSPEELERVKASLVLLKKACRARAQCSWKEWRTDVQRAAGGRLQCNLAAVNADLAAAEATLGRWRAVRDAFAAHERGEREAMQAELDARKVRRRCRFGLFMRWCLMCVGMLGAEEKDGDCASSCSCQAGLA